MITMANKTLKKIQEIRKNDEVLSWDFMSRTMVKRKVFETFQKESPHIIKIEIENNPEIFCTSNHPFYVVGKGWSVYNKKLVDGQMEGKVDQLGIGDTLFSHEGEIKKIMNITELNIGMIEIYNFEVEETGNYYAGGILVHNDSGQVFQTFNVSSAIFDTSYNYDFRNINDKGKSYSRGGLTYFRPCGSKRYALKVAGKFESDEWLGSDDSSKTWVNAYHGTSPVNLKGILGDGLKVGGVDVALKNGAVYGTGIYVTPFPEIALAYAPEVNTGGKTYRIVFQCRVKPSSYSQHLPYSKRNNELAYWVVKNAEDVRPYSICLYES
jgi:intein/homing endonuclease